METLWSELLASRCKADRVAESSSSGIYALWLDNGVLTGIEPADEGLLYIGMTEAGLTSRNHFIHPSSGFSTLRRSLGAILKAELKLTAIPRSARSGRHHFKFLPDGEQGLTNWMQTNLSYACAHLASDVRKIERQLILDRRPPLNLTGWKNPQAQLVKSLRALCR